MLQLGQLLHHLRSTDNYQGQGPSQYFCEALNEAMEKQLLVCSELLLWMAEQFDTLNCFLCINQASL